MAQVAARYRDELSRIKDLVKAGFIADSANNKRFHASREFVFKTALDNSDRTLLSDVGKPPLEFNMLNCMLSRLCGEYSKQEPSLYAKAQPGHEVQPVVLEVVQGYIKKILQDAQKYNTQESIYRDALSGGLSVGYVYADYANEMSFTQSIFFRRAYDPTLVVFDPFAREITKCDANWYCALYPMTWHDFHREYPDVDVKDFSFFASEGFSWSYSMQNKGNKDQKIVIVADFYEKKKRKATIVELADGQVMEADEYELMLAWWEKKQFIEQPPIIKYQRKTTISRFVRYRLIESQVLDHQETYYKIPNYVFFDGDSIILKDNGGVEGSGVSLFTKPYVHHAQSLQRLVNLAGQMIGEDFENMVMHKFIIAEEALPSQEAYRRAYEDIQIASTLVYKCMHESSETMLPPPIPVQRVPLPPEVLQMFTEGFQMLQNIIGSYDAQLGIQKNQLSGVAIVEGATQSNAAAMPYLNNNILGLNQIAQVILDIIPHIHVGAQTITIINSQGEEQQVKINQPGGVNLRLKAGSIHVSVEAGVNFAIAKNQALNQIVQLMQVSQEFAEFMATMGGDILLDSIDIHGIDIIKERFKQFMAQKQQQQQQMSQQPNPQMLELQSKMMDSKSRMMDSQTKQYVAQNTAHTTHTENIIKSIDVMNKRDANRIEEMSVLERAGSNRDKMEIELTKAATEDRKTASELFHNEAELALKTQHQEHTHLKDIINLTSEATPEEKTNV